MASQQILALDVGEKRIGVAVADSAIGIAVTYDTIEVDGSEIEQITRVLLSEQIDTVVVGYPRNQSGEATRQTEYVEAFAKRLGDIEIDAELVFQDESLTSVRAEELLKQQKRPYQKGDIDALAASLILQDYLELHRGRV